MSGPARYDPGLGSWVVEDPDDVRAVLLDPESFRPDNALSAHTPIGPAALRILAATGFTLPPALANNATDTHRPIRRLVAGYFSPARVAAAEPLVRAQTSSRITAVREALADGRSADLVTMVADLVPATVLLRLLGLDALGMDIPSLKRWSRDSLELFWGWPDAARQEELAESAAEFYSWLRARTSAARHSPGPDLFGTLVSLGLSDRETCAAAYFLLIAGHETTSQLISTAFLELLRTPGRWAVIGQDPGQAMAAVDDLLRRESSVPTWRRSAPAPSTIGSVEIPAGSSVLLRLTGRGGSADLAFGLGTHRCLGAALARMETRVAIEVASTQLPDLSLVEPNPPMVDLLSFRAPRRVQVACGGGVPM